MLTTLNTKSESILKKNQGIQKASKNQIHFQ